MSIPSGQLVSRINAAVQAASSGMPVDLDEIVKEYARQMLATNQRLAACMVLLSKGLRSEALHLLVVEPSVLPIISAFESASTSEFESLCRQKSLTLPARWTTEQITAVRNAAAMEKKLMPLLKKHRLGAMTQMPLPDRIATLRELAANDPGNPIWDQDLRTFETAWISDLIASTKKPGGSTLVNLQKVMRELTEPTLRAKPTKEQIALIRGQVQKLLSEKLDEETRSVMDHFHKCYLAADQESLAIAIREVEDLYTAKGVDMPPSIASQLAPAKQWLTLCDQRAQTAQQFEQSCNALRQAILDGKPQQDLITLKSKADAFELDLPEDLLWDLRSTINNQEAKRQRKVRLALFSTLVIITAIGVGTTWGMNKFQTEREAQRWAADIRAAITEANITRADELFEQLKTQSPWISSRPEFVPLRDELAAIKSQETARLGEFKMLLQQVRETPLDQTDAMAVRKLGELARSPQEENQVKEIHEKLNTAFLSDLGSLSVDVAQVAAGQEGKDATDIELKLQEYSDRLKKVRARPVFNIDVNDNVGPVEKQIAASRLALETRIKQMQREKDQTTRLAEMPAHAKSAIRLAAELEAFATDFPNSSESRPFKNAASYAAQWHAYQQWLLLVKSWRYNFTDLPIDDLGARLKSVEDYVRDYPQSPTIADAQHYMDYLKRASIAQTGAGPLRKNFRAFLSQPLIKDLSVIKTSAGVTYYTLGDGNYKATNVASTIDILLTSNLTEATRREFSPGEIRKPVPSPQEKWAQNIRDQITAMKDHQWPFLAARALESSITAKDIDPNVQVLLIRAALALAAEASWGIDAQVHELQEFITNTPTMTSYWLDPSSEEYTQQTADAVKLVQRASKYTGFEAMTVEAIKAMTAPMRIDAVGYGVLMGRPGSFKVLTTQTDMPDGALLLTIPPRGASSRDSMNRIGKVTDGKPVLQQDTLAGLDEGMMVFIVRQVEGR